MFPLPFGITYPQLHLGIWIILFVMFLLEKNKTLLERILKGIFAGFFISWLAIVLAVALYVVLSGAVLLLKLYLQGLVPVG